MNKMPRILAVITARGGSKGLPGKNIKHLHGKPLINWTIEAALNARYVSKTLVSTDDESIMAIAKKAGADVPFLRPDHLATDSASSMSCIEHAINYLLEHKQERFDLVLMLQPTSPLRNQEDIDQAIKIYLSSENRENETLVSVYKISPKYNWLLEENSGHLDFCFKDAQTKLNRQELTDLYLPNGAIYLDSIDNLGESFYSKNTFFYQMPAERSVDIDTIEDFNRAANYLSRLTISAS